MQIVNWSKYQDRKDVKVPHWFRMNHGPYLDPEWDDFDAEEHHVWAWLLAFASFKNRGEIIVNTETCSRRAKVSVDKFNSALTKLEKKGCISITSQNPDGIRTDSEQIAGKISSLQDKTGQDRTGRKKNNGTSLKGAMPVFDFEAPYRGFPKRDAGKGMGKSAGMRSIRRQVNASEDYSRFCTAVDNYARFVAAKRKADPSWCYSVQWSTFCSPTSDTTWVDWVEVERPDAVDSPKSGTQDERAASRARLDAWAKEQGLI